MSRLSEMKAGKCETHPRGRGFDEGVHGNPGSAGDVFLGVPRSEPTANRDPGVWPVGVSPALILHIAHPRLFCACGMTRAVVL